MLVNLRSDTFTLPTAAMRKAMAEAPVGNDGQLNDQQRGSDPTVNRLEDMAAEMLGKEAALFFPSGTLANCTAVATYCSRGDLIAIEPGIHIYRTEKTPFMERFIGCSAMFYDNDTNHMADPESFAVACNAPGVRLACIENSNNFAGGTCTSLEHHALLAHIAKEADIPLHLDGARIFNAAVALGTTAQHIAAHVDSVMFCISKGLGAPVGSLLCGDKTFIQEARVTRKLMGGGMRQAGVIAAAGIVALETGIDRLAEDHALAKEIGNLVQQYSVFRVAPVETNIVMVNIAKTTRSAQWFEQKMKEYGVLPSVMDENHIRFVTYRDITAEDIKFALEAITRFMDENSNQFMPA